MGAQREHPATNPAAGIAVAAVALGLMGTATVLSRVTGSTIDVGISLALVLVGLIGALLVWKLPGHGVSRVLGAIGVIGGLAAIAAGAGPPHATAVPDWQLVLGLLGGLAWYSFMFALIVYLPLVFPTGRAPSRRWRWVARAGAVTTAAISAAFVFQDEVCPGVEGECTWVDNPIGIPGIESPETSGLGSALFGVLVLCMVGAVASVVVRFVRSRGVERQQLKWLAYAITVFVASIVIVDLVWQKMLDQPEPPGYDVFNGIAWLMIPVAIAVAILRYRLYEIDRIISRTVSYAVLTALLAAVYTAGVFGLGAVARGISGDSSSGVVVAISTLVVAALFGPLRRMVQRVIDRRFNRHRLDAERELAAYTAGLRSEVEPTGVTQSLVGVVSRTVQPASTGVWIRHSSPM